MDWFRKLKAFFSILLIAWNQTRRPEPFKPEEGPDETDQPHTHQEALEPEESGAYEEQDQGGGVTTLKPRLIFGNSFANLLQCRIHNGGFLSSELPIHGPDVRVILTEGFHRSFRSGDRIRLQFGPVGRGVSLIAPIEVPLEAYTTEALAKSPKSPRPLPSGAPGYRPGKLRMLATDPEGNTLPGVKLTHTAKPGLAQILIMKTEACAVYETVASEALAVGDAVKRTSIEIHVAFFSNTNQDLPTPGQTKLIVTYIPNPKTFAHGSTRACLICSSPTIFSLSILVGRL